VNSHSQGRHAGAALPKEAGKIFVREAVMDVTTTVCGRSARSLAPETRYFIMPQAPRFVMCHFSRERPSRQ
jgi:hypothetical protein